MIKTIGVLTSGGDSPGMNAAIRSIVKIGINNGLNVFGINEGYMGLYLNNIIKLNDNHVEFILNKGGTILGSSRFNEFKKNEVRLKSIENLNKNNIDILIVIGGNGSYLGALKLTKMGLPCMCIPGTIDNDVIGTDYSIGFFTALETIVKSIDKLRDTCSSHNRILIVEVMGRNCGDLALFSSIASGCKFIILPEIKISQKELIKKIENYSINNKKKHIIIIITENTCNIKLLSEFIEKSTGRVTRYIILGYLQRGGTPISFDRILASRMGEYVIKLIINKKLNKCIGIKNNLLTSLSIKNININYSNKLFNNNLFKLTKSLF